MPLLEIHLKERGSNIRCLTAPQLHLEILRLQQVLKSLAENEVSNLLISHPWENVTVISYEIKFYVGSIIQKETVYSLRIAQLIIVFS